jgi:hypothetical protein
MTHSFSFAADAVSLPQGNIEGMAERRQIKQARSLPVRR